ncbi:hypothetical protein TNCV_5048021 [Trichonephila clavipes]|nr:hypothetical protein TNCV_5048021 [Trichonephila clavipes]
MVESGRDYLVEALELIFNASEISKWVNNCKVVYSWLDMSSLVSLQRTLKAKAKDSSQFYVAYIKSKIMVGQGRPPLLRCRSSLVQLIKRETFFPAFE